MSTRGAIGILNEDNTVKAVYLHCDAYSDSEQGAGYKLLNYYQNFSKILELIQGGGLVALYETIEGSVFFKDKHPNDENPSIVFNSEQEFLDQARDTFWAWYIYLYKSGEWYGCYLGEKEKGWQPLNQLVVV
jgi:hypothetical protein